MAWEVLKCVLPYPNKQLEVDYIRGVIRYPLDLFACPRLESSPANLSGNLLESWRILEMAPSARVPGIGPRSVHFLFSFQSSQNIHVPSPFSLPSPQGIAHLFLCVITPTKHMLTKFLPISLFGHHKKYAQLHPSNLLNKTSSIN